MQNMGIDLKQGWFLGKSGKKYFIDFEITTGRKEILDSIFLGYGKLNNWESVYTMLFEIFNECTTSDNPIKSLSKISLKIAEYLGALNQTIQIGSEAAKTICTLITYSEGEDRTAWTKELAHEKIEDWKEYTDADFFLLANHGFSGLTTLLSCSWLAGQYQNQTKEAITILLNTLSKPILKEILSEQIEMNPA